MKKIFLILLTLISLNASAQTGVREVIGSTNKENIGWGNKFFQIDSLLRLLSCISSNPHTFLHVGSDSVVRNVNLDTALQNIYFKQNGNSFGVPAIFGTLDNQPLIIKQADSTIDSIVGNITYIKHGVNVISGNVAISAGLSVGSGISLTDPSRNILSPSSNGTGNAGSHQMLSGNDTSLGFRVILGMGNVSNGIGQSYSTVGIASSLVSRPANGDTASFVSGLYVKPPQLVSGSATGIVKKAATVIIDSMPKYGLKNYGLDVGDSANVLFGGVIEMPNLPAYSSGGNLAIVLNSTSHRLETTTGGGIPTLQQVIGAGNTITNGTNTLTMIGDGTISTTDGNSTTIMSPTRVSSLDLSNYGSVITSLGIAISDSNGFGAILNPPPGGFTPDVNGNYPLLHPKWSGNVMTDSVTAATLMPLGATLTINGTTKNVSSNPSFTVTGAVSSVNSATGSVSLGIANMNDATITSPADKNVLQYNFSSSKWVNVSPPWVTSASLGTASTKNVGNTVVDPGTGALEVAMPTSLITGASHTYLSTDRGKAIQRSNSGSAMTDNMPSLSSGDNGYYIVISNVGTTLAETNTITTPAGLFPNGTTSFVLNYGCRQTCTWNGTGWVFVLSGNNALLQKPSGTVTAGDYATFTDATGVKITNKSIAGVKTDLGIPATIVSSVGASTTYPGLTIGGSPVTTTGTITLTPTTGLTANQFVGTPNGTTGPISLRSLVAADLPTGTVTTVGTLDANTTSTNGAVISGNTINLVSASATANGVVNQTTQIFAGTKTFSNNVTVSGATLQFKHLTGGSSAPGIAAGAGAGSSPTIACAGSDASQTITITTGTLPTLSAVIATITFGTAYSSAPRVSLTPGNTNAALLTGATMVFVPANGQTSGTSTSLYNIVAGGTALTAATQYIWIATVIQ